MPPTLTRTEHLYAFVPLAVLATAWAVAIAGAGLNAVSTDKGDGATPDTIGVLEQASVVPASVSNATVGLGARAYTGQIVADSSTNGIPAAALAAYQRAETLINGVDESCHLTWQVVAAIGRVESDHGQVQGNAFDSDSVARPGIFGVVLNGRHHTRAVRDTDAGRLDGDATWDRAVGPMQFIPSTWSAVGVDADGDGRRNPQDVDDAALATAVYLCSGHDDLSTDQGRRAAVYRYNHSQSYVNVVVRIAAAYLEGDFTPVPAGPIALPNYNAPSSSGAHTRRRGDKVEGGEAPAPEPTTTEPDLTEAPDPAPAEPPATGSGDYLAKTIEDTKQVVTTTLNNVGSVLTRVLPIPSK